MSSARRRRFFSYFFIFLYLLFRCDAARLLTDETVTLFRRASHRRDSSPVRHYCYCHDASPPELKRSSTLYAVLCPPERVQTVSSSDAIYYTTTMLCRDTRVPREETRVRISIRLSPANVVFVNVTYTTSREINLIRCRRAAKRSTVKTVSEKRILKHLCTFLRFGCVYYNLHFLNHVNAVFLGYAFNNHPTELSVTTRNRITDFTDTRCWDMTINDFRWKIILLKPYKIRFLSIANIDRLVMQSAKKLCVCI